MTSKLQNLSIQMLRRVCVPEFSCRTKNVHTSMPVHVKKREKRTIRNKYTRQLRSRFSANNSFAYDILQKQEKRIYQPDDEMDGVDFEEELLNEGRKRRQTYENWKRVRDLTKGAGPRLLTWKQMEHARFLRQVNPEDWNIETLSYSFQVPKEVMSKILKNRRVLSVQERDKLDAKARKNYGIAKLPSPLTHQDVSGSLVPVKNNEFSLHPLNNRSLNSSQDRTSASGWFGCYEVLGSQTSKLQSESDSGISWIDDDDFEFYFDLYNQTSEWKETEEKDENEEFDNHFELESDLEGGDDFDSINESDMTDRPSNIHSYDEITFFDGDGEFLYKV